jgi:putative glutamine amidotransferase
MKPIIGITVEPTGKPDDVRTRGDVKLNLNYIQAVSDAGGVPLLIPPYADAETVIPLLDGLLFPGGDDIDPARYGQEQHPSNQLQDPLRFESESALYKAAPADLPILGICYGCQVLNVLQGGSLHQHLPDVFDSEPHTGGVVQEYRITEGSKAAESLGATSVTGKSYHHQGVDRPGTDVTVTGWASDGTVEALEVDSRDWAVGVQWHPERTLDDSAMRNLFSSFVKRAATFKAKREDHG